MEFDGTVGYTPRLGGMSHAVVKGLVYSVGFIMIPIFNKITLFIECKLSFLVT